jgi:hypothetical protein
MRNATRIPGLLLLSSAVVVVFAFSFAGAKKPGGGGGGGGPASCDGQPIEVYDQDMCGANMWIQVQDSTTVCDLICWLTSNKRKCPTYITWIGGIVIVDPSAPNGFRFDPATVRVAEVTEEGSQTTICQIAANPSFYANAGHNWWISNFITEYRPL